MPFQAVDFHCFVGSSSVSSCDLSDGWYYNSERDSCIKMFSSLKNHQEAEDDCQSRGAKLPSIPNHETRDVYVSLLNGNNPGEQCR